MRTTRLRLAAATTVALALGACVGAGTSVGGDYPLHTADAKVVAGAREYAIWFHASRPTVFVQRNTGGQLGDLVAATLTLGLAAPGDPLPIPRAAARALIEDAGCSLGEIYQVGSAMSWEAHYACEGGGVVTQDVVNANRARWRAGLRVADPLASSTPTAAPTPTVAPAPAAAPAPASEQASAGNDPG